MKRASADHQRQEVGRISDLATHMYDEFDTYTYTPLDSAAASLRQYRAVSTGSGTRFEACSAERSGVSKIPSPEWALKVVTKGSRRKRFLSGRIPSSDPIFMQAEAPPRVYLPLENG